MTLVRSITRLLLISSLLAPAFAQNATPPPQSRTQAGLLAAEQAWVHALETSNATQLAAILAPGFADTSWDGHVWPRSTVLSAIAHRPPGRTLQLGDLSATVFGDTGVVRGLNKTQGPDGAAHALRFTDCFHYDHGHWIALSAQETLIH